METDWRVARSAISLFLNNKIDEAEAVFDLRSHSFHIKAGRCFVSFMNALMTFEDDKLEHAMMLLKDMEKECAVDIGWLKSVKSKVFKTDQIDADFIRKMEQQIVLADTQVCTAILILLQQELSGYVRGGLMLRKAWRVYQHTYVQILQVYRQMFGTSPLGFGGHYNTKRNGRTTILQSPQSPPSEWSIPSCNESANSTSTLSSSGLRSSLSMFFSLSGATSEQQTPVLEPSEVIRLMSAVSFGYGIFQLCVSLLPPSLLKLIHFLGFESDRYAGLMALAYARQSEDMRAPLASFSLLWYHTYVRPFFTLNGSAPKCGIKAIEQLIKECQPEFQKSALFLFFAGRMERLKSNVTLALHAYGMAFEATTQREMKLLCLHEVAWCHLIGLNYKEAHWCLTQLQEQSKWSQSFYRYIIAVCSGADGNFAHLSKIYQELIKVAAGTTKETQLGSFVSRRISKLIDEDTGQSYSASYYKLLVYELLYVYNALRSCSPESLHDILTECQNCSEEPMIGLSNLIKGATCSYLDENDPSIIISYRNCLEQRTPSKDVRDQHISVFALYDLGNILCNKNNVEEGKSMLLKAQSQYKDYDFESRLNVQIHYSLKNYS